MPEDSPQPIPQTSTGEIKEPTKEPTTSTEPASTQKESTEGSLLNQKDQPQGAPEKYEAFKAPEGFELDETVVGEAGTLFKEMNLSQDQAQKLVDFYIEKSREAAEGPVKFWQEKQQEWINEIKSDPVIGRNLPQVRTTVSKAIDGVLGPELGRAFREAMDYTGVGNNPAFIRGFYKFAQALTEGGHVAGRGPSRLGQAAPGAIPESAAKALFPNLP